MRRGHPRLADAALRLVHAHCGEAGRPGEKTAGLASPPILLSRAKRTRYVPTTPARRPTPCELTGFASRCEGLSPDAPDCLSGAVERHAGATRAAICSLVWMTRNGPGNAPPANRPRVLVGCNGRQPRCHGGVRREADRQLLRWSTLPGLQNGW
jgi:hypothetical protein